MPPQLRARNANTRSTVAAPVARGSRANETSDDEWETDMDLAEDEMVSQTSDVEMAGDVSGTSDDMSGDEGTGDEGSEGAVSDSEGSTPSASDDDQLEESDDEAEESDADTDYDDEETPDEDAQWPEPKSLVPAIATFTTATNVTYLGKPDAILALHKRTMDRAKIPERVRFRTQSKLDFKYTRKAYLRTRWQYKHYMARFFITGASLYRRGKPETAFSKDDVRVMLQRVADASIAVLEATMDFETNWDWGDFADPLSPDFQFQHEGRIAQIEIKSPATLSDEDIENLFHEIPSCLMRNVPVTPGGKAIPSLISLTELPKSRDDRKQYMLIFEQALAQMYHHNAHIGALTNFRKWIVFERGEQDMLTVYKLDAARPSRDKPRSQALDILLEMAMRALGPDTIRGLLRD